MRELSLIRILLTSGMIATFLFQDYDVRRPQENRIKAKATESNLMKIINKAIIPLCLLARILSFGDSIVAGRVYNIWPLNHIWTDMLCVALFGLGFLLRRECKRALGKLFTHVLVVQIDQKLVTNGPYGYVRHPSCTALMMMVVVCTYMTCDLWGILFAIFVISYVRHRIRIEEEMMMNMFKSDWIAYRQRVAYKLIPFVY